jgi:hypothetical protein
MNAIQSITTLANQYWWVLAVIVIVALTLDVFALEEDPSDAFWNWLKTGDWRDRYE